MFAVVAHRFFHLCCQLARGAKHQAAHGARFGGWAAAKQVQHGQGKGCCFACACLCATEQIIACKHQGNGLLLNRGGRGIADFLHGLNNGRSQLQVFKCHSWGARDGASCKVCLVQQCLRNRLLVQPVGDKLVKNAAGKFQRKLVSRAVRLCSKGAGCQILVAGSGGIVACVDNARRLWLAKTAFFLQKMVVCLPHSIYKFMIF